MRESVRRELLRREGERFRVMAIFERFGTKTDWKGRKETTLLLRDVRDAASGEPLTAHIWFTSGKTWVRLGLQPGDTVAFDARVSQYVKGWRGRKAEASGALPPTIDYRLERPTTAAVIRRAE
jgi:hypothetical protein